MNLRMEVRRGSVALKTLWKVPSKNWGVLALLPRIVDAIVGELLLLCNEVLENGCCFSNARKVQPIYA